MFRTIAHTCPMAFVSVIALSAASSGAAAHDPVTSGYSNAVVFCLNNDCSNGANPMSSLIADKSGNLYGTTYAGGSGICSCGTVYKLAPDGTQTVLYNFCSQANCTDGSHPWTGALYRDRHGNLYGTTRYGGISGSEFGAGGVVFKLAPDGTETVLYDFCSQGGTSCTDGFSPLAGVVRDRAGNLYGTTFSGGPANYYGGEVYKLAPDSTLTVLWGFCSAYNCQDGANPMYGNLLLASGYLYGTTEAGGAGGGGILYKLPASGGSGEAVLYSFCSADNCADGGVPFAGVAKDTNGNLYGTTAVGGAYYNSSSTRGGTAWMYSPATGAETVLHSFGNGSDGANPYGGVSVNKSGTLLYGTTVQGANAGCNNGCGIVFSLTNGNGGYTEKILHAFYQSEDGDAGQPSAGVISLNGYLYGTAQFGGGGSQYAQGVLFKLGTKGGKRAD